MHGSVNRELPWKKRAKFNRGKGEQKLYQSKRSASMEIKSKTTENNMSKSRINGQKKLLFIEKAKPREKNSYKGQQRALMHMKAKFSRESGK